MGRSNGLVPADGAKAAGGVGGKQGTVSTAAAPAPGADPPSLYASAHLCKRLHAQILVGLGLGTLLEWYDFQLYSGLSNTISGQFLPKSDPAAASIGFWGIFAAGFVTRPLGAIVFGHIGDRMGRRLSLLVSITAMALPTLLIGCLPSYDHIGIAAPILLTLLRVVQGLAIGGEYGTAVVYSAELAPPGWEGRHASWIVAFAQGGLFAGEVAVMMVVGLCSPEQLAKFGWRIPFLLVIFSASLALLLRLHMPEPLELIAQARLAAMGSHAPDAAATGAEHTVMSGATKGAAGDKSLALADDAAPGHDAAGHGGGGKGGGGSGQGGGAAAVDAAALAADIRHRVPLASLLRHHSLALLLHTLVAAYAQTSVYTVSSWLPNHLREQGVANLTTQFMFLTALAAKFCAVMTTGWAADKGMPICWAGVANSFAGLALQFVCASLVASHTHGASGLAGVWVLQVLLLGITGMALALLPPVGINIYPPGVRASGYNLSYSLASGLLGGLTPLAVTAIRTSSAAGAVADYAAAYWQLAAAGVSVLAYLAALVTFPQTNSARAVPVEAEPETDADGIARIKARLACAPAAPAPNAPVRRRRGGDANC